MQVHCNQMQNILIGKLILERQQNCFCKRSSEKLLKLLRTSTMNLALFVETFVISTNSVRFY